MRIFIFLSDILGNQVVDQNNRPVGKLCDVSMRINNEVYPRSESLIIKKGFALNEFAKVAIKDVAEIEDVIRLKIGLDQVQYEKSRIKCEFTLGVDILDQQVVDTDNQKVVRVNDVHLLRVDNQLYLAHVEIGLRGLIRRLQWTSFVDFIVKIFSQDSPYLMQEDFISWKNTQILTLGRTKGVLRTAVARNKLAQIPPTELAEIMEDLDKYEKHSLFKLLNTNVQRKVFTDLATNEKGELIDQLEDKETADLLENIPADEATDLLLTLPKERTRQLMRLMESATSKKLRKLLGFSKDSAGGLMTTEYLSLPQDALVKDATKLVKDNTQYPGNIYHIYIVDEHGRLLGSTSFRRFVNADEKKPIMETCFPKRIFVRTDDGMEEIALLLEKYKFSSIPVLDEEDVLQGVITTDDVMEELISLIWGKYKEKL